MSMQKSIAYSLFSPLPVGILNKFIFKVPCIIFCFHLYSPNLYKIARNSYIDLQLMLYDIDW